MARTLPITCFYSIVVTCPSIDPISNGGSITPSGSKVGATVYFFCNSRFKLHGTEYKHCAENGSWVPMQPLPTCHPISKYTQ